MNKYLCILVIAPTVALANDTLSSNNLLNALKNIKAKEMMTEKRLDSIEKDLHTMQHLNPEFGIADFMKEIRESMEKHQKKIATLEQQAQSLEGNMVKELVAKVTQLDQLSHAVQQGHQQGIEEFHKVAKDVIERIDLLEKSVEAIKTIKNASPDVMVSALREELDKLTAKVDIIYKYLEVIDTTLEKEGIF